MTARRQTCAQCADVAARPQAREIAHPPKRLDARTCNAGGARDDEHDKGARCHGGGEDAPHSGASRLKDPGNRM